MKKLNIYGANGHAKVIAESFLTKFEESNIYFFDDDPEKVKCLGRKINHDTENLCDHRDPFIIGVGDNIVRKKIDDKIFETCEISEYISHPTSWISNSAEIGKGTVLMAKSVVNAGTKIGKHCIINTGAIVDHDCEISNYVHIAPNASLAGGIKIGEGAQIGIGASIIQNIKIGRWCIIGAGAVIVRDVPDYSVIVGNPGKKIKSIEL
jgi:acetyltransferase EpsM